MLNTSELENISNELLEKRFITDVTLYTQEELQQIVNYLSDKTQSCWRLVHHRNICHDGINYELDLDDWEEENSAEIIEWPEYCRD